MNNDEMQWATRFALVLSKLKLCSVGTQAEQFTPQDALDLIRGLILLKNAGSRTHGRASAE